MGEPGHSGITEVEIRDALNRLLAAEQIRSSDRLRKFLTYIVEETLAGQKSRLKGYTIGVTVFDKPEDFDPATDATVRVEAIRLRQAMENHYLRQGRNDPVRIEIPKGGYAPAFQRQPDAAGAPLQLISGHHAWRNGHADRQTIRLLTGAVFGLSLMFAGLTLYFWWEREFGLSETLRSAREIPTGPKIAVLPFEVLDANSGSLLSRPGLTIQLTSQLSRFKDFFVLAANTTLRSGLSASSARKAGKTLGVDYLVTGGISQSDGQVDVTAQLTATRTGRLLWSQTYERQVGSRGLLAALNDISANIALTLGQPSGVINKQEARLEMQQPERLSSYACILKFFDYSAFRSAEKHLAARNCLLEALKEEPKYARAWAALSSIYGDEARYGFNPLQGKPKDRALEAARKGVQIDASDSFTHQYLASAYYYKGGTFLFRRHAKIALDLNPNDTDLLADLGWRFSLLSDWAGGIPLVEKAITLNPGHPAWYRGILALYYYLIEEYEQARDHSEAYFQPDVLLSHVVRVAIRAHTGPQDEAEDMLQAMLARFPDFIDSPRRNLRDWRIPEDLINRLMTGLEMAGLRMTS